MLKLYKLRGKLWQFEENEAPSGAVAVTKTAPEPKAEPKPVVAKTAPAPKNKAVTPANKAKKASKTK